MAGTGPDPLSRRERQIMDIVYARSEASVSQVLEDLSDPPSYSALRALMGILEQKGFLKHTKVGQRYIYSPTRPRRLAGKKALTHVLRTFYDGSISRAVASLIDTTQAKVSAEELDQLQSLIDETRKKV